jgi:hypothetical protein
MPAAAPGAERRGLWAAAIGEQVPAGTEVQIILGHSSLVLQCQEAPYLNTAEQRDVATRVLGLEPGGGNLISAAALDADPVADGGHILWLAAQPKEDMDDWLGAIQGAKCAPVFATPFQRALLRGMDGLMDLPVDRILLAMEPGLVGHLCIFHGRSLVLQRTFLLPADPAEAEELIFEEVSRLLQFFKQKNRTVSFQSIQILGLPELSKAFQGRLLNSLRLESSFLAPDLWPVLMDGVRKERARKDGLNLLPLEVQEARQRRIFRNLVWAASLGLGVLFGVGALFLFTQEALFDRELARAEQMLADRESHMAEEERVVQARLPLLRARLAEQRQVREVSALGGLGTAIFQAPSGIQLEKVEIREAPGDDVSHTFEITGLAFTEKSFSVGPLAQYLLLLGHRSGVRLEPVSEVTISDRVLEPRAGQVDQMAITRFTLKGSSK